MKQRPSRESDIYTALARYLTLKHPDVLFRFDFSAGTKMTMGQARVHKSMNPHRGYPDLFICRPSNGFAGLFIEIKQQGVKVAKLDGSPLANEHLTEQAQIIEQLKREGYYATFACGLMECIEIIEKYLR
jgi:hypothetical protein